MRPPRSRRSAPAVLRVCRGTQALGVKEAALNTEERNPAPAAIRGTDR
ncbi:hypothetical protein KPATCC21470_6253 [Kitasatospora purpeofusca]